MFIPDKPLSETKDYVVSIAQTEEELNQVYALRYDAFVREQFADTSHASGDNKISDAYDPYSFNIIVKTKKDTTVVACMRVEMYEMLNKEMNFYLSTKYDISRFPTEILQKSFALSWVCIDKKYRYSKTFFLLWQGLGKFSIQYKDTLQYYLGTAFAVSTKDTQAAYPVIQKLKKMKAYHESIFVNALPHGKCDYTETKETQAVSLLPTFRLYLRLYAKICSEPFYFKKYNTIEFMHILDLYSPPNYFFKFFVDKKIEDILEDGLPSS